MKFAGQTKKFREENRRNFKFSNHNFKNIKKPEGKYDVIVYAVNHKEFEDINVLDYLNSGGILIDIKRRFDKKEVEKNGFVYWGL